MIVPTDVPMQKMPWTSHDAAQMRGKPSRVGGQVVGRVVDAVPRDDGRKMRVMIEVFEQFEYLVRMEPDAVSWPDRPRAPYEARRTKKGRS